MFKKAERKQAKLKLAITGPSGSGKTFSALRLATGLGGKIAVIDTENGSASLYSDRFEFDVAELTPPYTVDRYLHAINESIKLGYDIVIIDSITHQWKGEGGILNRKEQMDSRGGNSFTNWAKLSPEQEKFVTGLVHSNIHLIATLRSKQEYAMATDDKGKAKIQKLGMAPIQREGMEYEFTTVFDISMDHQAECSKDRTGVFADRLFQITEKTGEELLKWLSTGKVEEPPLSDEAIKALKPLLEAVKKSGIPHDEIRQMIRTGYGAETSRNLSPAQLKEFIQHINAVTEAKAKAETGFADDEKLPFEK